MSSTSLLSIVSKLHQGLASALLLASGMALLPMDAALSQTRSESSSPDPVVVGPDGNSPNSPNLNEIRFSCQVVNGQYTVMYNPQSQPGQFYPWASPTALGGGWSPDRRCNEISRRLEFYRPDGLVELRTGIENGYNTVCVTTETVPACRIVLTVPPGQDPVAIRDRVFNNLLVADSGQQTTAVTAFSGNDGNILNQIGQALGINLPSSGQQRSPSGIDLRPFLDPADGGTGARLQGGTPAQSPRLNPDSFR